MYLFTLPAAARPLAPDEPGLPAGGVGTGQFTLTGSGEFRRWRMEPDLPERDEVVEADGFALWTRQGGRAQARALRAAKRWALPPRTWSSYDAGPLALESLAFSPMLPGDAWEPTLPLYAVVWRASNPTSSRLEAALMLTWACAWPDPVPVVEFDYQHDNLCLTGALGAPDRPERIGIAMPDLHSEGIYLQGIEPWEAPDGLNEVWDDFADDGELEPAVTRTPSIGAAAWVKFDLAPNEEKEIPFLIVWHMPTYTAGPQAGQERPYVQYLGKRRPDNAIVWLAEQAVQNFGAETPNYRYWLQQIEDAQAKAEG